MEVASVLPPERQETIDRIVAEHGDPDARRQLMFPPEESPLGGAELSTRPVPEIVTFPKTWRPPNSEQQRQTVGPSHRGGEEVRPGKEGLCRSHYDRESRGLVGSAADLMSR